MPLEHPIDSAIRDWLNDKEHVANQSELSVAVGRSPSWLHKYANGDGHATIDDLIRIAALVMGLKLPTFTATEQRLLKAMRVIQDEAARLDVVEYAAYRARLARRGNLKGSSEPKADNPQGRARKARGTR